MQRPVGFRSLGSLALASGIVLLASGALAGQAEAERIGLVELADVEWTEIVPGVEFGTLFGSWSEEGHGKLARFQPGVMSPMHTHGAGYHAVVISGTVVNPYEGEEDPPEMGPGTYWSTPAGAVHATGCVSEEPCLVYAHMNSAWDIEVVEDSENRAEVPAGTL